MRARERGGELSGIREEIWSRLSTRVSTVEELLRGLTSDQWDRRCEGEGWSVGLVGCHIGLGLRRQARWVERVLAGGPPHDFSWERTHALNALVQLRVLRPYRADVFRSLNEGLERWRQLLEAMAESDLSRPGFRLGTTERSTEWVAGVLVLRHIDEHTRSIRTALDDTAPPASPSG